MNETMSAHLLARARVDHISVIVRDIDQALQKYAVLYPGPFKRYEYQNEARIHGKIVRYELCMAVGHIGEALDVEIIQVTGGEHPIHEEFLARCGEGVEHIAYQVDDFEKSIQAFEEAGFPVILERADGTGSAVYMDTRPAIGMITELIRSGANLDKLAKAVS